MKVQNEINFMLLQAFSSLIVLPQQLSVRQGKECTRFDEPTEVCGFLPDDNVEQTILAPGLRQRECVENNGLGGD